jgi:hypothetical protein
LGQSTTPEGVGLPIALVSHFFEFITMSYHDQLHPWVVYRVLPNCQNQEIARFRRRNDASMYLAVLQRQSPQTHFILAFDPPPMPPQ